MMHPRKDPKTARRRRKRNKRRNVQVPQKLTKRTEKIRKKAKKSSPFFRKIFFPFSFAMSRPCGYSVCSLCRKNTKELRNIPEEYTGPIFPPTGHFQIQRCCRNCLRFSSSWIAVRFPFR